MIAANGTLPGLLRVLGDPTRLRILALVEREELSVGEVSRALDMAQSRVSNHLRVLREAGLLAERHAGKSVFLRHGALGEGDEAPLASRLWRTLRADLASVTEHESDLLRLERVLAERTPQGAEFFDRLAGQWNTIGVDFRTGQARQRAAAAVLGRGATVADLGCGTGYVAAALFGLVDRLICVDGSEGMLREAAERLTRAPGATRVEFRAGDLDALPLADGEVDGAVASMVLHHLPALGPTLSEMRRVIRPGGTAVAIDLAPHKEAWVRERLGDRHLGLEPADVVRSFERAGFEDVHTEPLEDAYQPSSPDGRRARLSLYLVRARVPRGVSEDPR